jgi:hypothetical protein
MYKIKDNINLEELLKYGYKQGKDMLRCSFSAYGKIYDKQLDNILKIDSKDIIFVVEIDKKSKEIELSVTTYSSPRSFNYTREGIVEPYIQDLIDNNIVERIDNNVEN